MPNCEQCIACRQSQKAKQNSGKDVKSRKAALAAAKKEETAVTQDAVMDEAVSELASDVSTADVPTVEDSTADVAVNEACDVTTEPENNA